MVRTAIHAGNTVLVFIGIDTAAIGAYFLNMKKDKYGVYHANFDCWQQIFGYNNLYDIMFDFGTSMLSRQFYFSYNKISYVFWLWKGDYVNLGAGAEMGIYYGGNIHWLVDKNLAMDMTMEVRYKGKLIISYREKTWWLTGFNPKYLNVKACNLRVKFTLKFHDVALYRAFYSSKPVGWSFDTKHMIAVYSF